MINSEKNEIETLAEILSPSESNLKLCAEDIKNGKLVSFPTETVYGLGANALDVEAVKKIFEYKGRPLSDPLIVHVTSTEMALSLVEVDQITEELFHILAKKYWPGPLTIILKANYNILNPIITANTGYVGIRFPNHIIAEKLITYSNLPIAAPSANKFCHISPVNPIHVFEDFKEYPVKIIDGGITNFCMESTVIKIINEDKKIVIYRMGAISPSQLQAFLQSTEAFKHFNVEVVTKKNKEKEEEQIKQVTNEIFDEEQEAPGQFIKHYSPLLDTYIIEERNECTVSLSEIEFNSTVLLDYNGRIKEKYGEIFGSYRDLSVNGSEDEVMHNLYDYLRWAESIEKAKKIVLCDLAIYMKESQHLETFNDRINKASSSKRIRIDK
jgi:tRNA threonylcarbamoyl adenosine modification protein (Sua5/YciO/YrdC/YwlC family)